MVKKKSVKFADLFCGVGGIRLGMESIGYKCVFSSDINTECQKTYAENFGDIPYGDITLIDDGRRTLVTLVVS